MEATPCILKTKTDYIRRVREVATSGPHRSSPRTVLHHAERFPLSLWFLQWERESVSPSNVGHFVGAPTPILHLGDCREICGA